MAKSRRRHRHGSSTDATLGSTNRIAQLLPKAEPTVYAQSVNCNCHARKVAAQVPAFRGAFWLLYTKSYILILTFEPYCAMIICFRKLCGDWFPSGESGQRSFAELIFGRDF